MTEENPRGKTPEELQARIDGMRKAQASSPGDGPSLAHAMVLFMTMGFTFAGSLVAAVMIGDWLAKRTGQQYWYAIMILAGVGGGSVAVWRLLQPLLKEK